MVSAFSLAIYQLGNKSFRRVVWVGLIGALGVFILLWFAVGFVLFKTDLFVFDGFLFFLNNILEWVFDISAGVLTLIFSLFLFPSVVSVITSFFLEEVAHAVETEYYPSLPTPRKQSTGELVMVTIKFAILSLVLNIFLLPVYVILIFIPPVNFFVFYALNGYLIGREFFELVAHRRMDPVQAQYLRRSFSGHVFLAGAVIAVMMTIPIFNLVAPVIGAAAMVFLFENWRNRVETA